MSLTRGRSHQYGTARFVASLIAGGYYALSPGLVPHNPGWRRVL